ncbi:MAG TPA: hypothetical protein VGF94_14380 [Kofleriaceae bacterium]|jgi:hypothetical protein
MMRRGLLLALVLLAAGGGSSRAGGDDAYEIIVNPAVDVSEIDRDTLRDIYLKKVNELDGHDTHPIGLASKFPAAERFIHDVLRKTPSQLKSYWNQQIFSGKGVPPPDADSPSAAIDYVLDHEGGVGYLPAGTPPGKAKLVRLR